MVRWTLTLVLAFLGGIGSAAEVTSNGTGGGPWSDPATWRGGKVPTGADDVVVRKFDVVTFDRDDDGKTSCQKLQIDPKGVLQFKTNTGKVTLVAADAVDNHGAIKLDGTRSATDLLELRLTGSMFPQRQIKLEKGSGLLLYGKAGMPEGKRNVLLTAVLPPPDKDKKEAEAGVIDAEGQVALDLQRSQLKDIKVHARKLDNTGAKPNEKINVLECVFLGQGRLLFHSCDTPVIAKNTFDYAGGTALADPAISTLYSPLTEIKNNRIKGKFAIGVAINYQTDSTVMNTTIDGCDIGIQGGYGIPSTMIKNVVVKNCDTGLKLEGGGGVAEEVTIEKAKTAFLCQNMTMQLTHVIVKDLDPKGVGLDYQGGTLHLLNCNFKPEQIKFNPPAATPPKEDPIHCQQYLIATVPDAKEGTVVQVRTAVPPLPADAADPNVRNTPAPLVKGLTPLPRTFNPLIVKNWSLDIKGKLVVAPEYQLQVLGPAAKESDPRPVLKTLNYRPTMEVFRPTLEDDTPTLKVPLK